ncbi:hypothetical protein AAE478_010379 [Parahypoxylon ruwenzoriense]
MAKQVVYEITDDMLVHSIIKASPISYVWNAKLRGSIFDAANSTRLVLGVNTAFFVEHQELTEALIKLREVWNWPLGELPEGTNISLSCGLDIIGRGLAHF